MIYTVTFNPSLDYVVQAGELQPGRVNRTTEEHIYPGGKGTMYPSSCPIWGIRAGRWALKQALPVNRWSGCLRNSDAIRILSPWKRG